MIYSIANKSISAVLSTVKDVIDFSSTLLYDTFISHPITSLTYEKLSERLTGNQKRILDVGVGTGVPLQQALHLFSKDCEITAIDIDHTYIQKAQQLFKDNQQVKVQELDFYQMNPSIHGKYDAIVFSSSFMVLQQQQVALQIAKSLLNNDGHIYFMITLSESKFGETLKYVTSIDLHLMKEKEFESILNQSQLRIVHKQRLQKVANIPTLLLKVFIYETKQ